MTGWRYGGVKLLAWVSYLFHGLNDKTGPVTHLAPKTDAKIEERINVFTSSYITESNENTFKLDVVFESFHHLAKIPISNRALLAGFLMIWLKRCMDEVIVAGIVYPTVLLAYGLFLDLLPAIMR